MSFVDLATLTFHRRNELEARIKDFSDKCDRAIDDLSSLKTRANGFVSQLNCEPSELKDRFLTSMKKLDEYMYLITDFNIAVRQLEAVSNEPQCQDTPNLVSPPPMSPFNIAAAPTTSNSPDISKQTKRVRIPKEEQLISLSSASTSCESVPKVTVKDESISSYDSKSNDRNRQVFEARNSDKRQDCSVNEVRDRNTDCKMKPEMLDVGTETIFEDISHESQDGTVDKDNGFILDASVDDPCDLPQQELLETDQVYVGTIMNIDGSNFWVITDKTDEVHRFMTDMTQYYLDHEMKLSVEQIKTLRCCAFYDLESECYYRGLFLKLIENGSKAEVFAVDTGELRDVPVQHLRALHSLFCGKPPYARCCHLAGIDMEFDNKAMIAKQENFMKYYMGTQCKIEVDDNTSESMGVYVMLPSGETLNDILVEQGMATPSDKIGHKCKGQAAPQTQACSLADMDITDVPEHDDPVEAVTGYHNRDEVDICKHYKGGPEKTCFKGARCSKKHILKHPDGWTRDRVEVMAKLQSLPMPPPNTWIRVLVTSVCHFDRVYVNILTEEDAENHPQYGMRLKSLHNLVRDMNTPAARHSYNPLAFTPAPGELVAALYPLDNCWYRARVITSTRADQNVQVMYVDYGTVLWVKESHLRVLEARHGGLPAQALRCVLAGVRARSSASQQWADAKRALTNLAMGATLDAHVVARDYDELIVEMYDLNGNSIAQQLYDLQMVDLKPYDTEYNEPKKKTVVP